MRWKAFIAVAILLTGLIAGYLFLLDSLMEKALIRSSEAIFGAKAEVDFFDVKLSDLSIEIRGYRVADKDAPMQNLFEVGRMHGDLQIVPLLEKKIVINELAVENISIGTPRTISGALERKADSEKDKKKKKAKKAWIPKIEMDFDLSAVLDESGLKRRIEELTEPDSLKSFRLVREVRAESDVRYKKWDDKIEKLDPRDELKEAEAAVREVRRIKSIKSLDEAMAVREKIDRLNEARKALQRKLDDIREARGELKTDMAYFSAIPERARAAKDEDYRRILERINIKQFDGFDAGNMSKALFGPSIAQKVQTARTWMDRIRRFMPEKEEKQQQKRKARGVDVAFPKKKAYPGFLIKQAILSGETKLARDRVCELSGHIRGITSNQDLYGAPTTFLIQGAKSRAKGFAFVLDGAVDHRGKKSTEAVQLEVSKLSLKGLNFGDSPYLPPTFDGGEGVISLDMRFDADAYSINLDARMQRIRFVKRAARDELQNILNEIYDNLDLITLGGHVKGSETGTDTRLSSNLDRYFKEQIRTIVKRKVAEAKARARRELDARVDQVRWEIEKEITIRRRELEGRIEAKKRELEQEIEKVRTEMKKHQQMVEDRIGAEKKKAEEAVQKEVEKAKKKGEDAVRQETEKAKKKLEKKLKKLW